MVAPGTLENTAVAAAGDPMAVPSEAAFEMVRRLGRQGVLVGPSGGAAVWGALHVARGLDHGRVVTLLPDGGQRYLSDEHLWGAP